MCNNHAEAIAKRVLEMAIPGARMLYRPEQSQGEYDFDLQYPHGIVAAVEVTASNNRDYRGTIARVYNSRDGGPVVDAVECKKSWIVFASSNEIRKIRENLDKYLARLEAEGLNSFSCIDRIQCVESICADLKVTGGAVIPYAVGSPKIRIQFSPPAFSYDQTDLIKAAAKEAKANKEKLGKAGTNERHLVVYVDQVNGEPWAALTSFAPPSEIPELPIEITHIWLIAEIGDDQFIVWKGSSTEPWRTVNIPEVHRDFQKGETE